MKFPSRPLSSVIVAFVSIAFCGCADQSNSTEAFVAALGKLRAARKRGEKRLAAWKEQQKGCQKVAVDLAKRLTSPFDFVDTKPSKPVDRAFPVLIERDVLKKAIKKVVPGRPKWLPKHPWIGSLASSCPPPKGIPALRKALKHRSGTEADALLANVATIERLLARVPKPSEKQQLKPPAIVFIEVDCRSKVRARYKLKKGFDGMPIELSNYRSGVRLVWSTIKGSSRGAVRGEGFAKAAPKKIETRFDVQAASAEARRLAIEAGAKAVRVKLNKWSGV